MPMYLFQDEKGNEIEQFFRAVEAPSIGTSIVVGGRTFQRVPSFLLRTKERNRKHPKYPYHSNALPRRHAMPADVAARTCFDTKGRPIIRNRSHEADVASRLGMVKE